MALQPQTGSSESASGGFTASVGLAPARRPPSLPGPVSEDLGAPDGAELPDLLERVVHAWAPPHPSTKGRGGCGKGSMSHEGPMLAC